MHAQALGLRYTGGRGGGAGVGGDVIFGAFALVGVLAGRRHDGAGARGRCALRGRGPGLLGRLLRRLLRLGSGWCLACCCGCGRGALVGCSAVGGCVAALAAGQRQQHCRLLWAGLARLLLTCIRMVCMPSSLNTAICHLDALLLPSISSCENWSLGALNGEKWEWHREAVASPSDMLEVGLALRWGCGVSGAGCSDMDTAGSAAEVDTDVTARHSSSADRSASTRRSAALASCTKAQHRPVSSPHPGDMNLQDPETAKGTTGSYPGPAPSKEMGTHIGPIVMLRPNSFPSVHTLHSTTTL